MQSLERDLTTGHIPTINRYLVTWMSRCVDGEVVKGIIILLGFCNVCKLLLRMTKKRIVNDSLTYGYACIKMQRMCRRNPPTIKKTQKFGLTVQRYFS